MRRILLIAGLCIVGMAASAQPGIALDRGVNIRGDVATELSAAKKKKSHRNHVIVHPALPAYAVQHRWSDPSFGPDGRPYRNPYPPSECSTDLGYGRFESCDSAY